MFVLSDHNIIYLIELYTHDSLLNRILGAILPYYRALSIGSERAIPEVLGKLQN